MVDDEDYPLLSQFKWRMVDEKGYKYVVSGNGKCKIHRVIMGTSFNPEMFIDHIDGDGMNNQRLNLRKCISSENLSNQRIRKNNTTGAKGVWINKKGKYEVRCTKNGRTQYGGCFITLKEAKIKYNKISKILHGEFSKPNWV